MLQFNLDIHIGSASTRGPAYIQEMTYVRQLPDLLSIALTLLSSFFLSLSQSVAMGNVNYHVVLMTTVKALSGG